MMKLIAIIVSALLPSLVFVPYAGKMRCYYRQTIIDLERKTARTQCVNKIYDYA